LSADFAAQSVSRLILSCTNTGQTAGTAAALSLKHDIDRRKVDRKELQRALVADGMDIGQNSRGTARLNLGEAGYVLIGGSSRDEVNVGPGGNSSIVSSAALNGSKPSTPTRYFGNTR
jgi:hypothetical protein